MYTLSKLVSGSSGRAAAATVVAGTAAVQPSASARASPAVMVKERHAISGAKFDDDWLLVKTSDEAVLFQPFSPDDIDLCLHEVTNLFTKPKPRSSSSVVAIAEVDDDSPAGSSATSVGTNADAIIELSESSVFVQHYQDVNGLAGPSQNELNNFLQVTGKLLKRPGMQAEIVRAMLEDEDVRSLMLGQSDNLDSYLQAVGVSSLGLLPPAAKFDAGNADDSENEQHTDVLSGLINAIATVVEKAGSALAFLGGWLRDRVQHDVLRKPKTTDESDTGKEGASSNKKPVDVMFGGVMILVVAVFCMLIIRRPFILRRAAFS